MLHRSVHNRHNPRSEFVDNVIHKLPIDFELTSVRINGQEVMLTLVEVRAKGAGRALARWEIGCLRGLQVKSVWGGNESSNDRKIDLGQQRVHSPFSTLAENCLNPRLTLN